MKKAVLFDFDGTLFFGTHALNTWCFKHALGEMGLPMPTREAVDRTIGMTFHDLSVLMTGSEEEEVLAEFGRRVFHWVPIYIQREVTPIPGERELLQKLREKASLAICSNAAPDYLLPLLDALGIRDCFEIIRYHESGGSKAAAIPMLMKKLGADTAIFAGDRLEDVQAARMAGIPVAGIRNAAFPEETDGADTVAATLNELFENLHSML